MKALSMNLKPLKSSRMPRVANVMPDLSPLNRRFVISLFHSLHDVQHISPLALPHVLPHAALHVGPHTGPHTALHTLPHTRSIPRSRTWSPPSRPNSIIMSCSSSRGPVCGPTRGPSRGPTRGSTYRSTRAPAQAYSRDASRGIPHGSSHGTTRGPQHPAPIRSYHFLPKSAGISPRRIVSHQATRLWARGCDCSQAVAFSTRLRHAPT